MLFDFNVPSNPVISVLQAAFLSAVGKSGPLAEPGSKVRIDKVSEDGVTYRVRYYRSRVRLHPPRRGIRFSVRSYITNAMLAFS
jgi:hypothetical protein